MTACRVRFGCELESGLFGVVEWAVDKILKEENIDILYCYYDESLYGCLNIYNSVYENYNIERYDYSEDDGGLEFVLKSSVSIKKIEENINKLVNWVENLGIDHKTAFSPAYCCGGHVHLSSNQIIDIYDNYSEYVIQNEIALKTLALYTAYALCHEKTVERDCDFRMMYQSIYDDDTKFQFVRLVNKYRENEHLEFRTMDSVYSIERYIDYLKLLRVFVRNTIDKDFNNIIVEEIIENTHITDRAELNDYIVNTYINLITYDRYITIDKEKKKIENILTTLIDVMSFKQKRFKERIFSYIYK